MFSLLPLSILTQSASTARQIEAIALKRLFRATLTTDNGGRLDIEAPKQLTPDHLAVIKAQLVNGVDTHPRWSDELWPIGSGVKTEAYCYTDIDWGGFRDDQRWILRIPTTPEELVAQFSAKSGLAEHNHDKLEDLYCLTPLCVAKKVLALLANGASRNAGLYLLSREYACAELLYPDEVNDTPFTKMGYHGTLLQACKLLTAHERVGIMRMEMDQFDQIDLRDLQRILTEANSTENICEALRKGYPTGKSRHHTLDLRLKKSIWLRRLVDMAQFDTAMFAQMMASAGNSTTPTIITSTFRHATIGQPFSETIMVDVDARAHLLAMLPQFQFSQKRSTTDPHNAMLYYGLSNHTGDFMASVINDIYEDHRHLITYKTKVGDTREFVGALAGAMMGASGGGSGAGIRDARARADALMPKTDAPGGGGRAGLSLWGRRDKDADFWQSFGQLDARVFANIVTDPQEYATIVDALSQLKTIAGPWQQAMSTDRLVGLVMCDLAAAISPLTANRKITDSLLALATKQTNQKQLARELVKLANKTKQAEKLARQAEKLAMEAAKNAPNGEKPGTMVTTALSTQAGAAHAPSGSAQQGYAQKALDLKNACNVPDQKMQGARHHRGKQSPN